MIEPGLGHLPERCFTWPRPALVAGSRSAFLSATLLLSLGSLLSGTPASAQQIGPSFSCTPPFADALARLTCSDSGLARADIRMVQAYYALRHVAGPDGHPALKSEFLSFVVNTRRQCGLPPVEPKRDQSAIPMPPTAARCVQAAYENQRVRWTGRLSGPAVEEAARPPERSIALQARLRDLGLLSKDAVADGVFGAATRTALATWQRSANRPDTGFLGDVDAAVLLGAATAVAEPPDRWAGLRVMPLAQAEYLGSPVTVGHDGFTVTLSPGTSRDIQVCRDGKGVLSSLDSDTVAEGGVCKTVNMTVTDGGRTVLDLPVTPVSADNDVTRLHLKVAIRRLDAGTERSQAVLSGYTGGAHCCTATAVVTAGPDGSWKAVDLGLLDGDQGHAFLDPARDGSTVLVSVANAFLYRFASYAGSFAPTRIESFRDGAILDVTAEPRFRSFLRSELRSMEQGRADALRSEPNGYWAAWAAQKALVGELDDRAWRTMAASHDRTSQDGLLECSVNERVWTADPSTRVRGCPQGYTVRTAFPEALAKFLVEFGYLTPAQSIAWGFDPAVAASRREALTVRFAERAAQTWFLIDRAGVCVEARQPASPADLVMASRARGVDASVAVIEADEVGKPAVARVSMTQGAGVDTKTTFYRGSARCEAYRLRQQRELDGLR